MEDYGLISVVIPVYNAEKYLNQCIQSVLAQTYKNYEIILVNDGSTDESSSLCDEFASRFSNILVFHKENGGASSARNRGIKEAHGEYIFFLDSDDYLRNDALEQMIVTANKEDADLVFCEAQAFDDGNNAYKDNYSYKTKYQTDAAYKIMETMMKNKEFHVAIWMLLIKKSVFDSNNLSFKEGIIYEDMIISYQFYCLAQKAAHVPEKLYYRRYRENSVMTSKRTEKNVVSAAVVYWEVSKFYLNLHHERQSNKHIVRCAFNFFSIYKSMDKAVKNKYIDDYKRIKKDIQSHNAYGDISLKLECKSHFLWWIYKAFKKVF